MSKHLTVEQRYAIFAMTQKAYKQKDIAEAIGVSKSTISRELKRNCDKRSGRYVMDLAQCKADERKHNKVHYQRFTEPMQRKVKKLLKADLSPEQIAGRSKLEGKEMVSYETIYQWIWADKRTGGNQYKLLRRQGRKYAKRGSKNAGRGFFPTG